MNSIALCYASGDRDFAGYLADFLELNLPVAVSRNDAIIGPDRDLMEATEQALSADAALVLLSPFSIPRILERKTWESAFLTKPKELHTLIGFVLVSECSFPQLLRRGRFFDATGDSLRAAREIKRWLLRPGETVSAGGLAVPELEEVRRAVADRPGNAVDVTPELALRFADECAEDFEAVYRIDCRARSRAGILGEIASATGLRLSGKTEQNQALLRQWCAEHRILFVLAGVGAENRDFVTPGGRASVISTAPLSGSLQGAAPSRAGDAVGKFEARLKEDKEGAIALGWRALNLLKEQARLEEVMEVLNAMQHAASGQSDMPALSRIEREQYWIRHDLDYDGPAPGLAPDPAATWQMSLPFEE